MSFSSRRSCGRANVALMASPIAAALATFLAAPASWSFEAGEVDEHPVNIDVTETAVLNYNFDNRNTNYRDTTSRLDDNWGEWRNRFNVQMSWWRLVLGLRVDSSVFFNTPNPNTLAQEDLENLPAGSVNLSTRTGEYGRDLSYRYLNEVYPSKLFLTYTTPEIEATVGDVYAQFGRGLVLSMRKIDELALDSTIRGGKLTLRKRFADSGKLGISLVGGYANPTRIDETSGRVLVQPNQLIFAGMPHPVDTFYVPQAEANFVPDRIVGGSLEGGAGGVIFNTNLVVLDRPPSCGILDAPDVCTPFRGSTGIRASSQVRNISQSLSIPDIAEHGSLYLEIAGQQQKNARPDPGEFDPTKFRPRPQQADISGHALYGALSADADPFTFTFEGKHYRKFFPLEANVQQAQVGRATEFGLLQYSAPPTTLANYNDTEFGSFNTCVTGGRGRLDARATGDLLIYAWVGRYATWGEQGSVECETEDKNRNNIWDFAVGMEALYEKKSSHIFATVGARDDQLAEPGALPSQLYYREGYVRYDLLKKITGPLSLQLIGLVRRRNNQSEFPIPWWEGENYTAFHWSPKLTLTFGHEYKTTEGDPDNYFNGAAKWRFNTSTSLRVFVGQQRGALRCISGVCREFPPFEGAKTEAVVRF